MYVLAEDRDFLIFIANFEYHCSYVSSDLVMGECEEQITDFFSYTSLEITKKSHTKITKSQKNHIQEAPKITNH